jgi:hypothetical protein
MTERWQIAVVHVPAFGSNNNGFVSVKILLKVNMEVMEGHRPNGVHRHGSFRRWLLPSLAPSVDDLRSLVDLPSNRDDAQT